MALDKKICRPCEARQQKNLRRIFGAAKFLGTSGDLKRLRGANDLQSRAGQQNFFLHFLPMKVTQIKNLTVSQSDLGKALNLTDRRIRQLVEEKIFPRDDTDPQGGVFLFESLRNYWLRQVEKNGDDYFKVKAQHEEVKKQLSEVKLRQLEGDLYLAVDVESALAEVLTTLRTNLLALPAKFSVQLEGKSPAEINSILTAEIEDKLLEISNFNLTNQ